jgi:hypothetical protein
MGSRGPAPKRDAERRRVNKRDTETIEIRGAVEAPAACPTWHKIALAWYEALELSGQAEFYEPSDWAVAYLVAESISRDLKPQAIGLHPVTGRVVRARVPLRGTALTAYLKAMSGLLVSEGDRRRAGVEISRTASSAEPAAGVTVIDEYRDRFAR